MVGRRSARHGWKDSSDAYLYVMSKTSKSAATLLLGVAVVLLAAWGDAGHRMTGEAAALSLPHAMPAFFRNASKQLAYLNPEPDRWKDRTERDIDRALEGGTYSDHFIDTEMAPPVALAAALKAPNRFAY